MVLLEYRKECKSDGVAYILKQTIIISWVAGWVGGCGCVGNKARDDKHDQVINGIFDFYTKTMLPIEQAVMYHSFHTSAITEGELRSPPLVLLSGPYSVGKSIIWNEKMFNMQKTCEDQKVGNQSFCACTQCLGIATCGVFECFSMWGVFFKAMNGTL